MNPAALIDAADDSLFGGKAAALAGALRAGLPVPPGFALAWQTVESIARDPAAAAPALAAFRDVQGAVSVRSSAVGEDSADASFAGQHLTVLNVTTETALVDAVRRVYESANTAAARQYRAKMDVHGEARIAVVVQRMIDSDAAGVLFTRNPITGAEERVVEASWGLGEAVVAGLVTPDRYRMSADGLVIERRAGVKDIEIRFAGDGTEERPVADARARELCLADRDLEALHRLAAKCQESFGEAIDLEWAIEDGELYLLQARPITAFAAPEAARVPEPRPEELTARRLGGFALAAILSPLNSTMIAVALPAIGAGLGAGPAALTLWLVSAYLLISILVQSPAGKLADSYGYDRVLSAGRLVFAAGAILGAMAPTLALLGIARAAMAVGGALNIPPVMAEMRNHVAPERRGRLFGIFGALMGTAAAIGPLVGDLLVHSFGWRSVFLVNLPIIALSFVLAPPRASAPAPTGRRVSFDFGGTLRFALALTLVVAGTQMRSASGWSVTISGVALLFLFVRYERRVAEPLLDPRLFSIGSFSAGSSIVALQNFTMYAVLFLVPFLLAREGHSGLAGVFLLSMSGAMVLGSPLGGRLSDAIGARATTAAGATAATAGAAMLFAARPGSGLFMAALALLGSGIGFATSPSQAAALSAVPREHAGAAAGAMSTMRYIGGVLGSGVVAAILASGGVSGLIWLFPLALLASVPLALVLPGRGALCLRPVTPPSSTV